MKCLDGGGNAMAIKFEGIDDCKLSIMLMYALLSDIPLFEGEVLIRLTRQSHAACSGIHYNFLYTDIHGSDTAL